RHDTRAAELRQPAVGVVSGHDGRSVLRVGVSRARRAVPGPLRPGHDRRHQSRFHARPPPAFFFFYCYRAHRDLHSFPTRRSSDLTGYTLVASATQVSSVTSQAFDIIPGTASQLIFSVQPLNTAATFTIIPAVQVSIADSFGNVEIGRAHV